MNTYDIVVDGSLPYEVFSSVVSPTEFVSGNKVVVERGQTVEITVRIYKSGKAGIYKPEIKITDSQGSVVVAEPVEVKFGTYLTVGGIIGIIAGVALLAVGALAVFHMQQANWMIFEANTCETGIQIVNEMLKLSPQRVDNVAKLRGLRKDKRFIKVYSDTKNWSVFETRD